MGAALDERLVIKDVFTRAIDLLESEYKGSSLTDVFVVIDDESAMLSIYDDENNFLTDGIIEAWKEYDLEASKVEMLISVLQEIDDEGYFDKLNIYTPFSINLSDENFIVEEELLYIEDDSIVRIEDDLLNRLDKDFDEFLDKLLNE